MKFDGGNGTRRLRGLASVQLNTATVGIYVGMTRAANDYYLVTKG
jgi:hypothetical protein